MIIAMFLNTALSFSNSVGNNFSHQTSLTYPIASACSSRKNKLDQGLCYNDFSQSLAFTRVPLNIRSAIHNPEAMSKTLNPTNVTSELPLPRRQ